MDYKWGAMDYYCPVAQTGAYIITKAGEMLVVSNILSIQTSAGGSNEAKGLSRRALSLTL